MRNWRRRTEFGVVHQAGRQGKRSVAANKQQIVELYIVPLDPAAYINTMAKWIGKWVCQFITLTVLRNLHTENVVRSTLITKAAGCTNRPCVLFGYSVSAPLHCWLRALLPGQASSCYYYVYSAVQCSEWASETIPYAYYYYTTLRIQSSVILVLCTRCWCMCNAMQ